MDDVLERYELACGRIREVILEIRDKEDPIHHYMLTQGCLLEQIIAICRNPKTMANETTNSALYSDIDGEAYETSYTNPTYCRKAFTDYGTDVAAYLNWIATHIRDAITAAYEKDIWTILTRAELFLELYTYLSEDMDTEELATALKEMIYYFIHDYDDVTVDKQIRELVVPDKESLIYHLVMETDHTDPSYLYQYGEYISHNELEVAAFLSQLPEEEIRAMAATYTEGYKKGFEVAGIDLAQKESVEIRYPIGFERMVREAVLQFDAMGLKPTFRRRTNTQAIGVISTPPSRQYLHDHRFDDALYLNQAIVAERLKHAKKAFETYKSEAITYAGPAVIETFGEDLFHPESKKEAPKYTGEQEKISLGYRRDFALLQDDYIPGDKRSFTIIAYPIPEIGEQFEDIFRETVRINTLDTDTYQRIHQALIDALDAGNRVHVWGQNGNRTDITVQLHELADPAHQTNFENCLADVNIPVGEVFTSPVLTGTNGVLHVSRVYLNGLDYQDLELTFTDGKVSDYRCGNYADVEEGKAYIKENILHNHDTLPIGEFAIGTNTTAYVMGRKYGIEARLPILIAEKTGPHFAVGDTCYSMSEEVRVYNPDGKEIIAKDNECSILRKEDPQKAYFQCHTDITIPYEELGGISVFTKDEKETIIIRDGRFVLPGTEGLNDALKGGI
ncbi:MAG: aminopeptidase [Eubacterium sp.]|nr:aminopeptidase [Eubacterium sp.]